MDVKSPSKSKVSKQAIMVASAIPGAGVSKIASSYVPGGNLGKIALGALALVGAASVTGSTTGADVARGMLVGAAIQQVGDVVMETVQPYAAQFIASREPSKLTEAVSKFSGLSSPHSFYEGRPAEIYPHEQPQIEQLGNPFPHNKSRQLGV